MELGIHFDVVLACGGVGCCGESNFLIEVLL